MAEVITIDSDDDNEKTKDSVIHILQKRSSLTVIPCSELNTSSNYHVKTLHNGKARRKRPRDDPIIPTEIIRKKSEKSSDKIGISISGNQNTEVKITVSNGRRNKNARKTLSSFTPKVFEVVELSDDDNQDKQVHDSSSKKIKTEESVDDSFESFLNQCCIALREEKQDLEKVQKKLIKYFKRIDRSSSNHCLDLQAFLLQQTTELAHDGNRAFLCIQKVLLKFKSLSGNVSNSNRNDVNHSNRQTFKLEPNDVLPDTKHIPNDEKYEKAPSRRESLTLKKEEEKGEKEKEIGEKDSAKSSKDAIDNADESSVCQPSNDAKTASKSHIKKLKRALEECAKEIAKLEETEVDFDDDDNSAYVLECRYKERYMKLLKKICELEKEKLPLHRKEDKPINCPVSRYPEINSALTKHINRNKRKNRNYFPDFQDIYKLFETENLSKNLGMGKDTIYTEALSAFQQVGKKLKSRRAYDNNVCLDSYLKEGDNGDPELPEHLRKHLDESASRLDMAMNKIIEETMKKQEELPEGGNDDDDDVDDVNSSGDDDESDEEDGESSNVT